MNHEIKHSDIVENYEAMIEHIAGYARNRLDNEEGEIDTIINEEIDTAYIYYVDQAVALAYYFIEQSGGKQDTIDWGDIWEMIYNDVYRAVEKGGENE